VEDDLEKLEKKFKHHVEKFEELHEWVEKLSKVEPQEVDVKALEKMWKKEIDHECDKLEKKLKKLKHEEREHQKDDKD